MRASVTRAGKEFSGDPIRALGEQRHAVDGEGERFAPRIGFAAQREGAQAKGIHAPIERRRAREQHDLKPVEGLRAQAARPPQSRSGHRHLDRRGLAVHQRGGFRPDSLRGDEHRLHLQRLFGPGVHFRARDDPHFGALMLLAHLHIGQAGRRACLEADILPDADGGKFRPPIPAPLVGRLPQVRPAGDFAAAGERPFPLARADVRERRTKANRQFIISLGEQPRYLEAPGAELVVGFSQRFAVEENLREGVEAFAKEESFFPGAFFCVSKKNLAVFPVALGHPLHAQLVVGEERVGNAAKRQQVGVHSARHRGRQPFGRARLPELPLAAEILFAHRFDFLGFAMEYRSL